MKVSKEHLIKIFSVFILLQPFIDILTSLNIRYFPTTLTVGVIVRFAFIGFIGFYLLFVYNGKQKRLVKTFFLVISLYGVIFIAHTVSVNGMSVFITNLKMFLKLFYFLYVLLLAYVLWIEFNYVVSDKIIAIVCSLYAISIFLSAITNTSFGTYDYAVGYCGWFYAGNEIGAIISILSIVAVFWAFTRKKIFYSIVFSVLIAFCSVYIGTKVPFFSVVGAIVILIFYYGVRLIIYHNCEDKIIVLKAFGMFMMILLLYYGDSPIKINNNTLLTEHYQTHVEVNLQEDLVDDVSNIENSEISESVPDMENSEISDNVSDTEDVEKLKNENVLSKQKSLEDSKLYLIANWIMSDRLYMFRDVLDTFVNSSMQDKLFGLGYDFKIKGVRYSNLIEMDFAAIIVNQGVVGFILYLLPILCIVLYCIRCLFGRISHFWKKPEMIVYGYACIIGFGCAAIAGHVLTAPGVSIYIVILLIKLYETMYIEKQNKKELSV